MSNNLHSFERGEIVGGFRQFVERFPEFIDMAQMESNSAESWRDFDVGVIGAAIVPGVAELQVIPRANYTHNHLDDEMDSIDPELSDVANLHEGYGIPRKSYKNCGEVNVLLSAEEIHRNDPFYFVGFVVAGTTDKDEIYEVNEVHSKTLVPCSDCTTGLDKSSSTSRATLFASTGYSSRDIFEIRTITRLRELHKMKTDGAFNSVTPRLSDDLGVRALEIFDNKIENMNYFGRHPSRMISSAARASLIAAGRESF